MKRRELSRRVRWTAGALLALAGGATLADAVATVVWEEPVSALEASGAQRELRTQYVALARRWDDVPDRSHRTAMLRRAHDAGRLNKVARPGTAVGRLSIARIGLSEVWVQGTDTADLNRGPGHYPETVLPGRRGTVGLAGHRTTHGAPFKHIDRLRRGDKIRVSMPYGSYTYAVERTRIVSPEDVRVLRNARSDRLVLTACHPLWSAKQRIIVTAKLVRWPGMLLKAPPLRTSPVS